MAEECKVGIISLHMIFDPIDGWLYGLQDEIEEELKGREGYETEEVMLYDETNRPPSTFEMISSEDARDKFVANYNENALFRKITKAVKRLKQQKGCDHVVLAGESLGAVMALKFVESHPEIEIAGVAAWYPHFDYPQVVLDAGKTPPDYARLKVPTVIFVGADEKVIVKGEGGIDRIRKIDRENPFLVAHIYDKPYSHFDVGHPFFTPTVGGLIPNPYYDKATADMSWRHFINWLEGFRHEEPYVDLLGFIGDVGGTFTPDRLDETTIANIRASGVKLFSLTVAWPGADRAKTYNNLQSAISMLESRPDVFCIVRTKEDLRKVRENNLIGVVLDLQDSTFLDGLPPESETRTLAEMGVRAMQLAYQGPNSFASGFLVGAENDRGVTESGRQLAGAITSAGMILDCAHLSPESTLQCINATDGPMYISHTVTSDVYEGAGRGVDDDALIAVKGHEGALVGIMAMTFFLNPSDDTLKPLVRHIRHVAGIVGTDKVAIGSDSPVGGFTDIASAKQAFRITQQRLDPDDRLKSRWPSHVAGFADRKDGFDVLRNALLQYFTREEVDGMLGGNAWRFFENALSENALP